LSSQVLPDPALPKSYKPASARTAPKQTPAVINRSISWIIDLYDKAVASANDGDRQNALAYLEDHPKRRN
jgi:hypothetical protein